MRWLVLHPLGRPEPRAGAFECGTSHVGSDVLSALKPPLRRGVAKPGFPSAPAQEARKRRSQRGCQGGQDLITLDKHRGQRLAIARLQA